MTILPLISLDLETTGLEPSTHAPWEMGWITAYHDQEHNELVVERARQVVLTLDPEARIDPVALRISGFRERYAAAGHRPRLPWWIAQELLFSDLDALRTKTAKFMPYENGHDDERVKLPPTHFVGACPQFDHRMLERWLGWAHRHWHYHLIDVETLCAAKFGLHYPLDTTELTAKVLGPWDDSRKHEAIADARWNIHLYAAAYGCNVIDEHIEYPYFTPDPEPI